MFKPVALYIGLRYTRAKRRNHFISFISGASMIGIALGVAVLITVLSVMNGFDHQIRTRIFGMANQVTVSSINGKLPDWKQTQQQVANFPGVLASAPFVRGQGLLTNPDVGQLVRPVLVTGVEPQLESSVSKLPTKMVQGSLQDLHAGKFGIVLGIQLAQSLGVGLGDRVVMVIPEANVSIVGINPVMRAFRVVGIFKVGKGFGFDTQMAFVNMQDAQKLYRMKGNTVSGLRLKIHDLYAAQRMSYGIQSHLGPDFLVTNWTQDFGSLFAAIRMEKTMMFMILLLIIAVAAFNLVSSLVMVVTDKQADIAILRTLGATPRTIMKTFMVQGTMVGFVGTLIGLVGGVLLSWNVSAIEKFIEHTFHVKLISANVYFVNYLPSELIWSDVWHVCLVALAMSLVATLYPAWRASRVQPAEALRYD